MKRDDNIQPHLHCLKKRLRLEHLLPERDRTVIPQHHRVALPDEAREIDLPPVGPFPVEDKAQRDDQAEEDADEWERLVEGGPGNLLPAEAEARGSVEKGLHKEEGEVERKEKRRGEEEHAVLHAAAGRGGVAEEAGEEKGQHRDLEEGQVQAHDYRESFAD